MNRIRRAQRPLVPVLIAIGLLGAACGSDAGETTAGGDLGVDGAIGVDGSPGSDTDSATSEGNDSATFDPDKDTDGDTDGDPDGRTPTSADRSDGDATINVVTDESTDESTNDGTSANGGTSEDDSSAGVSTTAVAVVDAVDAFTESGDDWTVTPLGQAMVGDGEFVRLTELDAPVDGSGGDETSCLPGWLGLQRADGRIHRYASLGPVGQLRLFNGPRGQDALVVSCEETVERVLVQGSAIVPDDGVPRFTDFELGAPYSMDYLADYGWRGDLFGGFAWSDGWDELVYFDTGSGLITEASVLIGERIERVDYGYDFVLPDGWSIGANGAVTGGDDGRTLVESPDDLAWLIIEPLEWVGDPEIPADVELLDFTTDEVPLWEYVSAGRATRIGSQARPTWSFHTGDGLRTVMHLEGGDIDLIVDYYVADADPWNLQLMAAVVEQIRGYATPTVG